jgi:hypothetical protein
MMTTSLHRIIWESISVPSGRVKSGAGISPTFALLLVGCIWRWLLTFSRAVSVGWAMNARMITKLVKDAFQMAWRQCQPAAGLLFHSDRGSQYTSHEYRQLLQRYQLQVSMSGTSNS